MKSEIKDYLCLALDVEDISKAKRIVQQLKDYVGIFKIGLQLFSKEGPRVVKAVQKLGGSVFLDLKFHDIPNTVAEASRMVTKLGVSAFNVHAAGGKEMLKAAVQAAKKESDLLGIKKPTILAVTVLTSIDHTILENEMKVVQPLTDYVVHLAVLSKEAGVDGVIASPWEINPIRQACGNNFIIGTPGIRSPEAPPDDQRRTLTPREAIESGASFIVVGRPIREATDPIKAAKEILSQIRIAESKS